MSDQWTPDPAQPQNSKRETDQNRRFDQTQLKAAGYGYAVHRDYAGHFFRWGFAKRFIHRGDYVLDVGCGQDQPLARVLAAGVGGNVPERMVAVDYNPISKPLNARWLTTLDRFDFTKNWEKALGHIPDTTGFNVIVCLEVIEHMHTFDAKKLLSAIWQCLDVNRGRFILSTPVFNGKAAANHIHEYTIPELQEYIEDAGFTVVDRFGTFASANDIKRALTSSQREDYERLCDFYDGDVAACFYAPLYPDHSRNNTWVLTHHT